MASPKFDVELHTASDCLTLATNKTYLQEVEIESIANQINIAARAGETKCMYQSPLSDNAKEQLESKGYKLYHPFDRYSHVVVITWGNND